MLSSVTSEVRNDLQELYQNYVDYVGNEFGHGAVPLRKRQFGDALSDRGFEKARGTGLNKHRKMGLKSPGKIQAATRAYRAEMDVIEQWLEDNCRCRAE